METRQGAWSQRAWLTRLLCFCLWVVSTRAAFVQFDNCVDVTTIRSSPRILQFVPLNVTAFFNTTNPTHNLNVTVYGNVTGQSTVGTYPPPSDPSWSDPSSTFGKILDVAVGAPYHTTLFAYFNVLSYTPYSAPTIPFCNETVNVECPVGPAFYTNSTEIDRLPGWTVAHDMQAAYAFAEIVLTTKVQSGYEGGYYYGCVNAYITPDLGQSLRDLIRYLPLAVLIIVGIATISAAMFSPWGTWDIFRWTSNSGRDEDVLRLVTPGFGDCLQYIQFIVLTGSLSLNYPGFYQPVVSQVGWSALLFNESLVTDGNGTNPVADGIYQYRNASDSGMDRMTQLIGMTSPSDAWADMMVWLVVIIVSVAILTQIGFALRWFYRQAMHVPAEDLRSKNWYFTVGNVIRVAIGFFVLPLVSLSMYQFAIAPRGPVYSVALAAVVLVMIIVFAVRLVLLFARTRPRSFLFDDLQTVLAYGPLYNTFRDDAATFAMIPILVNFLRGIAIGAVQASGIAQIVLLAISEVVFILTINAFRPYPSGTSMNLYHTCFSALRIVTVLLSVAFAPSLGVSGGSRGWIGYAILLIHACVLVFGFLLNAVQTLIEVVARRAGAGGGRDAARGGLVKVFGVRQLSKRMPRPDNVSRHSMASNAAMLNTLDGEPKDMHLLHSRTRSMSASSQMLLDGAVRSPNRGSQVFNGTSDGQITPDAASTFSKRLFRQSAGSSNITPLSKQTEAKDPYYRPPRRNTMDLLQSPDQNELTEMREALPAAAGRSTVHEAVTDRGEGSSTPMKVDDFNDTDNELTRTKTDYAVREVDFYYGVRGPALSSGTRKLKTGPADPTGPVSNATGWFKGLMGNRKKEKSKGFEVVRSARAPPPGLVPPVSEELEPVQADVEPYQDSPLEGRHNSGAEPRSIVIGSQHPRINVDRPSFDEEDYSVPVERIAAKPPSLPLIDSVGGIELPSRIGSEASRKSRVKGPVPETDIPDVPKVPRRSSRRTSSVDNTDGAKPKLSQYGPSAYPGAVRSRPSSASGSNRIPFANTPVTTSDSTPNRRSTSHESAISSAQDSDQENQPPQLSSAAYAGASNHAGPESGADAKDERPSSLGFVRGHRASDGIVHHTAPVIVQGKSAEIHGAGSNTVSTQQSGQVWSGTELEEGSSVNPYGQPGQRLSRFRD